jgi:hypothetical protein
MFDATLSGSEWGSLSIPVALPPAIEFVASGDIALLRNAGSRFAPTLLLHSL